MPREKCSTMQNIVEPTRRADTVGVRLPSGMKERLRAAAARERRSLSNWVENALIDALEQAEKWRKPN